jgi:hypothetical protein
MGQRNAVFRYNHSQSYVDLVLSIADAYLEGDFTTIPNNTTAAGYIVPKAPTYNPGTYNGTQNNDNNGNTHFDDDPDYVPTDPGTDPTDPGTDPTDPTDPGTDNPGGNGPLDPDGNNVPDTGTDLDEPLENLIDGLLGPLSQAVARVQCAAQALLHPLDPTYKERCLSSYGL